MFKTRDSNSNTKLPSIQANPIPTCTKNRNDVTMRLQVAMSITRISIAVERNKSSNKVGPKRGIYNHIICIYFWAICEQVPCYYANLPQAANRQPNNFIHMLYFSEKHCYMQHIEKLRGLQKTNCVITVNILQSTVILNREDVRNISSI